MQAKDLLADERKVLFGLLAHLSVADNAVQRGEVAELDALGEELGVPSIQEALTDARGVYATPKEALAAAAQVTRPDARELIRTMLHDLSTSDGERSAAEAQMLSSLAELWPRS
jgi:uncharacterized tellurite resistance protein B-like protein